MDVVAPLVALVDALARLGSGGVLLASGIVGLTLAVILVARFGNLWGAVKERQGAQALMATLIGLVEAGRAAEEALRRRLDEAERDRSVTRDELDEQRAQVALLRNQRRRLLTMMRELVKSLPEPAIRAKDGAP